MASKVNVPMCMLLRGVIEYSSRSMTQGERPRVGLQIQPFYTFCSRSVKLGLGDLPDATMILPNLGFVLKNGSGKAEEIIESKRHCSVKLQV